MKSLTIQFQVEKGADADKLAGNISARLSKINGVEKAQTSVKNERILAETVAVIAGFVLLTKAAREGVDELKKLLVSLRDVVKEVKGLKGAVLDFGGKKIPLDDPDKAIAALTAAT